MLSACFVLPVRDSIVEIFNSIKHTALIQKAGGGTGFAFDELRPTGDYIRSSGGTTSGPISFWRAFSEATNAIQQGAFRRGANMGMMYIHHPDILKFLHAKQDLNQFTNYNISVKVTDAWMDEFLADPDSAHVVRNPRTGRAYVVARNIEIWKYTIRDLTEVTCVEPVAPGSRAMYYQTPRLTGPLPESLRGRVYTKRDIWNIVVNNAWETGEPGVVFIDRINEHNPTPHLGRIEATNPCGEQPLLPYEACNLGSLNLGLFVHNAGTHNADVDWDGLREAIGVAVRFLDNVIDANNYPLPEIERICRDNRKIGLGVMGFADALFLLGVPYNSDAGVAWGERLMKFVHDQAHQCSEELARQRGCFPNWKGSLWHTRWNRMMRNAAVTTVAPTGTISIIANCSGGIEPLFSLAFIRNVLRGQIPGEKPLVEVNTTFREVAVRRGFYSEALLERVAREGTLAHLPEVPDDVKRIFVCAHDISPEWHMQMQAAFQRHCDSSISKTINFPNEAPRGDVEQIYQRAYELRCKGVTVYRDGCRTGQPMALKADDDSVAVDDPPEQATQEEEDPDGEAAPRASVAQEGSVMKAQEPPPTDPAPPATRAPTAPLAPPCIEPLDLPEIVSGLRIRQMTPFGNMHVKITVDPRANRELEVFAQLGKGGDVANSDLEAVCRMVSLWLRSGGSLRHVIKQLEGIGSSLQIPTRTGRIMSLGDGLACALKKYTRAKERFGLRNLLLGEIDLAELDNPNPPPHHPETTPLDGPVPPSEGGNGGDDGHDGNGAKQKAARENAPAALERRVELRSGRASRTRKSQPPKAIHAGNGKKNGKGNGQHADVGVTIAELEEPAADVQAVAARASAGDLETSCAAERRAISVADLSSVLGSVRHRHDAAMHYEVRCPECGSVLMLQEGCRKCANAACGWAAC
jgi:ribonucleoside-diphosphate reductase alpha chain